jgi:CRP/FNR family transcriptional regulator
MMARAKVAYVIQPGGAALRPTPPADSPCDRCELGDSFCSGLSGPDLSRLAAILGQVQAAAHETVFREGDPAHHYFSLAGGAVKLYKLLPDGRRQITAFLFPGDFFGLAVDGAYAYSAEAITPAVICRFPRLKLSRLMTEVPALENRMFAIAVEELAAAHEQMLLLGRKTAREKVATFLLMLAGRSRRAEAGDAPFEVPMGRADIADYLGLTIETVSRTLTMLKREEIIGLPDNQHAILLQPAELRLIAQGG